MEEKIIQQESVAPVEQSVAATDASAAPAIDVEAIKAEYEGRLTAERASREKAEKSFSHLFSRLCLNPTLQQTLFFNIRKKTRRTKNIYSEFQWFQHFCHNNHQTYTHVSTLSGIL